MLYKTKENVESNINEGWDFEAFSAQVDSLTKGTRSSTQLRKPGRRVQELAAAKQQATPPIFHDEWLTDIDTVLGEAAPDLQVSPEDLATAHSAKAADLTKFLATVDQLVA